MAIGSAARIKRLVDLSLLIVNACKGPMCEGAVGNIHTYELKYNGNYINLLFMGKKY